MKKSEPKKDKFGLLLGDEDSESKDGSGSGEGESSEPEAEAEEQQVPKKKKVELSLEDLERAGYKSGPSVLLVKPPVDEGPSDWTWGKGRPKGQKDDEGDDRAATRDAVAGVNAAAEAAVKAMAHAAELREAAKAERLEAAAERNKPLSFNQKEKRKRDTGQASRGKSYVEESKRQARDFGVYSGFD
ncbi:hypothetical protein HYH03_008320 [Edaphochlamys debaryana]|uniref:Uncharacterized protein n=1 Tax=Edaphochlamys debaryana TaxID=47281 RepID=A0A835Y9J4_9CHLO|nr:hypothetical protein HYH03_008320 [Edaphochlamys debaryana]|eukprot:KAG2493504.1 hypothetical protein HYH03_008320 [Edaphochlamys debaryana]